MNDLMDFENTSDHSLRKLFTGFASAAFTL